MLHSFRFAIKMMQKRPLRMGLTLLQVAVGVAVVTVILSFIFALVVTPSREGDVVFQVEYGKIIREENTMQRWGEPVFSEDMVKAFREKSTYAQKISIVQGLFGNVLESGGVRYQAQGFMGSEPEFAGLTGIKMIEGSFLTQADIDNRKPVLVISTLASEQLFGKESAVGKKIIHYERHGNNNDKPREWEIIGVYSLGTPEQGRYSQSLHFVAPYTAINEYYFDQMRYMQIWVTCKPGDEVKLKNELNILLQQELASSGYIPNNAGGELMFEPVFQGEEESQREAGTILGLFFGSFAFIALIVSSIGVLSMMMVSVVERTREIGLRRALGASRLSIVGQVLAESIFISLMGGIVGICLAGLAVKPFINDLIIKNFLQGMISVRVTLTFYPILIALGCVLGVGLIAGFYPGLQAARATPVNSIREN